MSLNYTIPYKVGSNVSRIENGKKHIDQIYEYVIDKSGLSVALMLDVNSDPRLSSLIDIKYFMNNWTLENGKIKEFDLNAKPKTKILKRNIIINKK